MATARALLENLGTKKQHFQRIQNAIFSRCLELLAGDQLKWSLKTESGNNIGIDTNNIEDRNVFLSNQEPGFQTVAVPQGLSG